MKFYKNKETKEAIIVKDEEIVDDSLVLIKAFEVDGAVEKHVPVYEVKDNKINVKVGEIAHPMSEEHYIMWIALINGEEVTKVDLKPTDEAVATFDYIPGAEVYAYCNLHGLWKTDIK